MIAVKVENPDRMLPNNGLCHAYLNSFGSFYPEVNLNSDQTAAQIKNFQTLLG